MTFVMLVSAKGIAGSKAKLSVSGRGPCFHRDTHLCLDYTDQLHGESENKMRSY